MLKSSTFVKHKTKSKNPPENISKFLKAFLRHFVFPKYNKQKSLTKKRSPQNNQNQDSLLLQPTTSTQACIRVSVHFSMIICWPNLTCFCTAARHRRDQHFHYSGATCVKVGFSTDDVLVYNIYDITEQRHTPCQIKENG